MLIILSPSNKTESSSFEIAEYIQHSNTAMLKSNKGTNKSSAQKHYPLLLLDWMQVLMRPLLINSFKTVYNWEMLGQ